MTEKAPVEKKDVNKEKKTGKGAKKEAVTENKEGEKPKEAPGKSG